MSHSVSSPPESDLDAELTVNELAEESEDVSPALLGSGAVAVVWSDDVVQSNLLMHGIFFVLASGVILMSFAMRSEGPSTVFLPWTETPMPDSCVSRKLSGLDCPGCGLTRSFISISHGQWTRAWNFNAAGFALYPFVALQIPWSALQMYLLKRRRRSMQLPYLYLLPIVVVTVLCFHWLWRLSFQLEAI